MVASADREPAQAGEISGALEMTEDRLQPLRPLGVAGRNPMLDHPAIREQTDGHRVLPGGTVPGQLHATDGISMSSNHSRIDALRGQRP